MSGPVLWGVDPIETEGLMSLVTRTVTRNILPSAHVLLRQVGAGHANNPTAAMIAGLDEDRLATILRQPNAEIARRRHTPRPEHGFVDFFGTAVRADEILFRRRRFGPAAVGASPHARALWSLKTVPCCTEHWQYLVDACACGAVQRWQSAERLDRCDVCNAPLASVPVTEVELAIRDQLAFLISLIDPDADRRTAARTMLPIRLTDWDGGMVLELALALMPLTATAYTPRRSEPPPTGDVVSYATALAEAADIVRAWPGSFVPALERAVVSRSLSRRNVRYTGVANHLTALGSDMLPPSVRAEIEYVLAPITAACGATPADQMGMMEAAAHLGRNLRILAPARRAGHLKTRICLRSNRVMPTLDRDEVERICDFSKNRVSGEKASSSYHLPAYAINQLTDAGLLDLETHPFLVSHHGGDPQLHRAELDRFKARIRNGAMPPSEGTVDPADHKRGMEVASDPGNLTEPVTLQRAARAVGGGLKPWGTIFERMMLDPPQPDRIRYVMDGDRAGRIRIEKQDALTLRGIDLTDVQPSWLPPTCSQRDALEILNLPAKHAPLLKIFADADDGWEMDWDAVRRLARERITLTEMCARTGIEAVRLERLLEEDGCPRSDRFGWWRQLALARLPEVAKRGMCRASLRTPGRV